ncbi:MULTISPECIES: hypothetical protein [Actinomadura]|uniref:DNA-directed RNA polymerase specialized sigma subunit, sigma24 family n=1 Tax=Actinomadura yumaensis TaxID=111807 RepID=A0ABW2CE12_9ACTN|nr:hypothetical protein [Actinomadura sp. J1-007]MWK33553.1 hypothetical protein [Actinomadura sp. J1-007]
MRGDPGSLYDAHAARLYAHCWSLLGDRAAAAAVADAFTAAVHQPPRGDSVLWLYSLSRSACAERGAFSGEAPAFDGSDPLLRAAAALRADHREVLLLWAGEWLEVPDIARVLGIAPDTVAQLLNAARTRLERVVLDTLMRGTSETPLELIAAFEKGRLPRLLAQRAPSRPPEGLRERVVEVCEAEATRSLPSVTAPTPLVVIGPGSAAAAARPKRGLAKGIGALAGVAASVAAAIGLLASWPSFKGSGNSSSLVPSASNGHTEPAGASPQPGSTPPPGSTGAERSTGGPNGANGNPVTSAFDDPPAPAGPGAPGSAANPGTPGSTSPGGRPSKPTAPSERGDGTPSKPGTGTPKPPDEPSTPPTKPTTPPDDGSETPPTDPPGEPTDPPTGEPSPTPTSNPAPSPSG